VEIKMVRSKRSVETTISEGLVQIAKYIERTNPQEAHLVVFNPHLTKWDERVFVQERVFDGHNVTVWGM
ncbi:MAG: hypothetical protein FWD57_17110, partial [Polyangiaceae bacterium]|nr:hypothetical protein [Polyangiaceae bacterium]